MVQEIGTAAMNRKRTALMISAVFAGIGLLHFARIYYDWSAIIGGWTVPMWLSWIAVMACGALSYFALGLLWKGK
jgi:hypothetical protein